MTPEEIKAKELIDKYRYPAAIVKTDGLGSSLPAAKQCAIICVDEILSLKMVYNMGRNDEYNEGEFYEKVKQAIQNT